MAQIINNPSYKAAAGSALGQALQGLANTAVGEFTRNRQRAMFERLYPQDAELLANYYDQPAVQQKLLGQLDKQRALQSQQEQEMLELLPENLLRQGYPTELVRQVNAIENPKYKRALIENYLKQQNKPEGVGEALGRLFRDRLPFVPGQSRLPGIGQELAREQEASQRNEQYYPTSGASGLARGDSPINPAPLPENISNLLGALAKPGLPLTGTLEGAAGLPGSLQNLGRSLLSVLPLYDQKKQDQYLQDIANKIGLPNAFGASQNALDLPTASDLRQNVTKPLAKALGVEKHFVPQNETEDAYTQVFTEIAPEVIQALGSGGALPIAKGIGKGLARGFGANALGWATQSISGSEKAGNAVKLGVYLASSFFPTRMNDIKDAKYATWDKAVSDTPKSQSSIPLSPIDDKLQSIQKSVNAMDTHSPAYKFMQRRFAALEDKLNISQTGKQSIDIDNLSKLRKSQSKLYPKAVKVGAEKELSELLEAEKHLMSHWASTHGKSSAFKQFEDANQIYASLKESEKAKGFLSRLAQARSLSFGLALAFGRLPGIVKGAIVGGAGLSELGKSIKNLVSVPAISKEYARLAKLSAQNNLPAAALSLQRLDKLARKADPKAARLFDEAQEKNA